MTNKINGGPSGPDWVREVERASSSQETGGVGGVTGAEFDAMVAGASVEGSGDLQGLEAVVHDVAVELKSGQIAGPDEALEAVVDRLVDRHFGHIDAAVRERMGADMRDVLLNDPYFVLDVEELIGNALMA